MFSPSSPPPPLPPPILSVATPSSLLRPITAPLPPSPLSIHLQKPRPDPMISSCARLRSSRGRGRRAISPIKGFSSLYRRRHVH
jgi:hypothetical protein